MSSPCPVSRAKVTQEAKCFFAYPSKVPARSTSSLSVLYLVKRAAPCPPVSRNDMVEPGSNILELRSEVLEGTNASERTYGKEDIAGGDDKGGDARCLRRIRPARTLVVEREPGNRGWRLAIGPTSNGLNVRGTSTPGCLSPNGQPAENNKWKQPARI